MNESAPFDTSGSSVGAGGDANGDGIADVIIGAQRARPGGRLFAGRSYVVYGRSAVDSDGDGLADSGDNCTLVANADQRDTNADGIGNICDADLNNSCSVNAIDARIMRSRLGTDDPDADLNGDGVVSGADVVRLRRSLGEPPGPSGVPNICSA